MPTETSDTGMGGLGVAEGRKLRRASDVRGLAEEYRRQDPQGEKRGAIMRMFYRHPHKVDGDDRLLEKPTNTNYGMLYMAVRRLERVYEDMVRNRRTAFRMEVDPSAFPASRTMERRKWGAHITAAFERYFIRRWRMFGYNLALDVRQMLLFGRGIEWWPEGVGARSRWVLPGLVYPNVDAGHDVDEWDSCAIWFSLPWVDLVDKAKAGGNWDASAVAQMAKAASGDRGRLTDEQVLQAVEDGTGKYSVLSNRSAWMIAFYQRQRGGKVDKYVVAADPGGRDDKMLMRHEGHAERMGQVVALMVDDVGHGSFYKTPSFAELLFVASVNYDRKMNRAGDAAELNCMLMTEGGDSEGARSMGRVRLGDRVHFPPGCKPAQVKFALPVAESMEYARAIFNETVNASGAYQIGQTNVTGAKTPKSATQSYYDAKESERATGADLGRFNDFLTLWGRELYRRFIGVADGDPDYDGLRRFRRFLEARGVPEAAWAPENIEVVSRLALSAGSVAARIQNAVTTLDLLERKPTGPAQRAALHEALVSVNGADAVDDFVIEDEMGVPDEVDRIIGLENEQLRDEGARAQNVPVLDADDHVRHLWNEKEGGVVPGHVADLDFGVSELIRAIQVQPMQEDLALFLDKIAGMLTEVDAKMTHCAAHLQMLSHDPGKAGYVQLGMQQLGALEQGAAAARKVYDKLQSQRAQAAQEARAAQQGGMADPEQEMKLSYMEREHALKLQHTAEMQRLEREGKVSTVETAAKVEVAKAAVQAAAKARSTPGKSGGSGSQASPNEPKEPREPGGPSGPGKRK